MGASRPIGATRIGAEVFRLDKFRAKIERSANPSGPDREGFFIFGDQAVVAIDSAGARKPGPKSRIAGRSDISLLPGTSFNGRTAVLQAANVGSIPTVSTNLRS